MDLDAPFPIDQCRARLRNVILAEFQGRTPTLRKVISISDREWLKMPGMGPGNLEELRHITRRKLGEIAPNKITSRSLSTLPVDELLPRLAQLQNELRAVAYEICMRAKPTGTEGSGN